MTPIALFIFNREEVTARLFATIRALKPKRLLVIADGPRSHVPGDAEKCARTRQVVEAVDWECTIDYNYSDTNLGCRNRMFSGITWVFEAVESAIILEDDCIPHPDFFSYCHELLERFKDDRRIISISGDNYQAGVRRGDAAYYFSKYPTCCGWASWRDRWRWCDLAMPTWIAFRDSGALASVCPDPVEREHWNVIFDSMYRQQINSWAYAWVFAAFANHALSVHPNVNLISNIGFGADATHTVAKLPFLGLPTQSLGPLCHPSFIAADAAADLYEFDTTHGGLEQRAAVNAGGAMAPSAEAKYGHRVRQVLGAVKRRVTAAMGCKPL